jgi:Skp family chaperone for outer membrane proteins
MSRLACLLATLLYAGSASAADIKICMVDADEAINQTQEGKSVQASLEGMYAAKQTELEKAQKAFEAEVRDYESRRAILSEAARAEQEQSLMEKQQELQMKVLQAEQEMQQELQRNLMGMEEKLTKVAETLGAEKGCTMLLLKGAMVYASPDVVDLTSDLVKAYDAK